MSRHWMHDNDSPSNELSSNTLVLKGIPIFCERRHINTAPGVHSRKCGLFVRLCQLYKKDRMVHKRILNLKKLSYLGVK